MNSQVSARAMTWQQLPELSANPIIAQKFTKRETYTRRVRENSSTEIVERRGALRLTRLLWGFIYPTYRRYPSVLHGWSLGMRPVHAGCTVSQTVRGNWVLFFFFFSLFFIHSTLNNLLWENKREHPSFWKPTQWTIFVTCWHKSMYCSCLAL